MRLLPLTTVALVCSNCAHQAPYEVQQNYPEPYRPVISLEEVLRNRAEDPSSWIEGDPGNVRTEESVAAYNIGRRPSHDHRAMHEAHPVYRISQSAQWNLASREKEAAFTEPVTGVTPITQLNLRSDEIDAELAHQREITNRLEAAEIELQQLVEEARAELESVRQGKSRN